MKIGRWILATVAAVATAVVLAGCPSPLRPAPPPPVQMEGYFSLADQLDGLTVGETDRGVIFAGAPIAGAGGEAQVLFEVVEVSYDEQNSRWVYPAVDDGRPIRNALRIETVTDWAGMDLAHANFAGHAEGPVFAFQAGDTIEISGQFLSSGDLTGGRAVFFGLGGAWAPPFPVHDVIPDTIGITDDRPFVEAGAYAFFTFQYAHMTPSHVMSIASASPPVLRFRGNTPGGVYIITDLVVERNVAASVVTVGDQTGTAIVAREAGTASFQVGASFLDGGAGDINFMTPGVVTISGPTGGLAAISVSAESDVLEINDYGSSASAATLVLNVGDNSVAGTYIVTVALRNAISTATLTVGPGRYVTVSQIGFNEERPTFEVVASNLATRTGLVVFGVEVTEVGEIGNLDDFEADEDPVPLDGVSVVGAPTGFTVTDGSGSGLLTLDISNANWDGADVGNLVVTMAGTSSVATRIVVEGVAVGDQTAPISEGIGGNATFPVRVVGAGSTFRGTTVHFNTPGVVLDLPEGVDAAGNIAINAEGMGTGTLTLSVPPTLSYDVYGVTIRLAGFTSREFPLIVVPLEGLVYMLLLDDEVTSASVPVGGAVWNTAWLNLNGGGNPSGSDMVINDATRAISLSNRTAAWATIEVRLSDNVDEFRVGGNYTISITGRIDGGAPTPVTVRLNLQDNWAPNPQDLQNGDEFTFTAPFQRVGGAIMIEEAGEGIVPIGTRHVRLSAPAAVNFTVTNIVVIAAD